MLQSFCLHRAVRLVHPSCRSFSAVKISAAMVKELREKSGAGMMDCKKALADESVNGDLDKAMDWLRTKGIAKATSQATRSASEGAIAVFTDLGSKSAIVMEVNTETDFVSRNGDFHLFLKSMMSTAANSPDVTAAIDNQPTPIAMDSFLSTQIHGQSDKVNDAVINAIATIKENIVLRRANKYHCATGSTLGTYVHGKLCDDIPLDGGVLQIGTQAAVVQMSAPVDTDDESLSSNARKLAMHIVAANPSYLRSQDAPADVVERERAIFEYVS